MLVIYKVQIKNTNDNKTQTKWRTVSFGECKWDFLGTLVMLNIAFLRLSACFMTITTNIKTSSLF